MESINQLIKYFTEQDPKFYFKIFIIIFSIIVIFFIISKIFSVFGKAHEESKFNKKQKKIKKNKRNVAELNKRAGISGRISSAAFTEAVDIEDIKENNNVDLASRRVSSKELRKK